MARCPESRWPPLSADTRAKQCQVVLRLTRLMSARCDCKKLNTAEELPRSAAAAYVAVQPDLGRCCSAAKMGSFAAADAATSRLLSHRAMTSTAA
eukprot:CAMPEP_0172905924 /NCGR_PEP_ID=MMETSP1075-20121228/175741_1 /TAXON_ID=2916 /ORGANISM="Ceratium fusus, Strain PA161109" /LENGTH=94 /DNA_ID=CAMNT_0013763263 /DNA_START=114 /DNA_END=393 /DNA_ORIENTATION=+